MSEELEIEELRFRVKSLETQLALTQRELDAKRKACVVLTRELGRQNVRATPPSASVPPISSLPSGRDTIDDTLMDGSSWERLRVDFLGTLDELERVRAALKASDDALRGERERRLRDVEKMHQRISEKENEMMNYRTSFDAQMKRSVELEDRLAKSKPAPVHRSSVISSTSSSTVPSRSFSPPPMGEPHMFSRNYFHHQPQLSNMSLMSGHSFSPVQSSGIPMFSPVLVSRQILPQPNSQNMIRRGSG